jgi:phosphoribosylformimino-5-aminoimidazole carboxamide ribotide isomerase
MIIIPSIDLKEGNCVRLVQGDFRQCSIYSNTPKNSAQTFFEKGARALHIVDLDGAKNGQISQIDCIQKIKTVFSGLVQVGGGIRESKQIDSLLDCGVQRVVLGSRAVQNITQTAAWLKTYGSEKIVLAFDFRVLNGTPYLAVNGWQEQTEYSLWNLLDYYPELSHVLCTDISKDGMQAGPNMAFYQEMRTRYPYLYIQASGGISTIEEVIQLKNIGIYGAIIGKALYENKINLEEAIQCSKSE